MFFIGTLLFAEYAVLSSVFDIRPLIKSSSPLSVMGYLGTLGAIILTALLIISGKNLYDEISCLPGVTRPKRQKVLWVFHITSFVALAVFFQFAHHSTNWLILWLIMALCVGVSGLVLAIPIEILLHTFRHRWKLLTLASALGTLAWGVGLWSEELWSVLGRYTYDTVVWRVHFLPGTKIIEPEKYIVGTTSFSVLVDSACRGYQGIGIMSVFIVAYLYFQREVFRFPAALLLFPVSISLVWLANSLRIFALILIGVSGHPNIAVGGFHAQAGWLLFCFLALAIVAVTRKYNLFQNKSQSSSPVDDDTWNPTTAYLLPFLAAIGVSLVTEMIANSEFDPGYPLRIIPASIVLWVFRQHFLSKYKLTFSWVAVLMGALIAVVWTGVDNIFAPAETITQSSPLDTLSSWSKTGWLAFRITGACLVIPIIEELAFRGYLLRKLIDSDFLDLSFREFTWLPFVVSSLAFGLMHGD